MHGAAKFSDSVLGRVYGFCILFHMVYVNPYGFNDLCIGDLLFPQKRVSAFFTGLQ